MPDLDAGLERIWTADNIAIVVLMVCLLFSGAFNIILLRGLLKMAPAMTELSTLIKALKH